MRVFALSVMLLATPAIASDPKPASPAKEKKICKRGDSSASRLGGTMVCKTKAEWDADREATQKAMDARARQ